MKSLTLFKKNQPFTARLGGGYSLKVEEISPMNIPADVYVNIDDLELIKKLNDMLGYNLKPSPRRQIILKSPADILYVAEERKGRLRFYIAYLYKKNSLPS